jgi:RNA polymerase sigma factor (sigma-70 family)
MREKPVELNIKPANLLPLTKRDADGTLYVRESKVDKQIIEALQLNQSQLIERIGIRDTGATGYFQEECLVYLIRHFRREGIQYLESELISQLMKRCAVYIDKKMYKLLDRRYHDEALQDVYNEMVCKLIDIETNKQDFAQYRFWHWLKRIIGNALRSHFHRQAQNKDIDSLEEMKETNNSTIADQSLFSPYQYVLSEEALDALEPHERLAFKLRYYAGWEIENRDPNVLTISKYMKKTPETIHNWLRSAKAKLSKWRGGIK